jgi:hypothetical protein
VQALLGERPVGARLADIADEILAQRPLAPGAIGQRPVGDLIGSQPGAGERGGAGAVAEAELGGERGDLALDLRRDGLGRGRGRGRHQEEHERGEGAKHGPGLGARRTPGKAGRYNAAMHKNLEPAFRSRQYGRMDANRILLEAIALRKCVEAVYNRTRMRLAPHILYTRHDELYLDAVALERDGRPAQELKIGTFKLAGLKELALMAGQSFQRVEIFDPAESKYAGVTLFAVEGG